MSDRDVRLARRAGWPIAATALLTAFLLVGTAPSAARADSNFERGFEDQMGRILAYEAVNLGKHILVRGVLQPQPTYYGSHHQYADYGDRHRGWQRQGPQHDHWRRHDHDRGYWKRKHRKEVRHHRHHHDCHH